MSEGIRYTRNGDVSLAYQVSGAGPLDLVFVSGFVSHQEVMWDDPAAVRVADRLGSFARLVRYDKRDQGLSDRFGRPPTLEESMDDLRAVMDAAGVERAALWGVSEGGPMCQLFAATFPERVSALVLYGTYARMVEGDGYDIGVPPACSRSSARSSRATGAGRWPSGCSLPAWPTTSGSARTGAVCSGRRRARPPPSR